MKRKNDKNEDINNIIDMSHTSEYSSLQKGELGFKSKYLYIAIINGGHNANKIGKFTNLEEFDSFVSETATGTNYTFEFL